MMAGSAKIGRDIREKISATLRDVMLQAADNLRNATPVDTTNAQNNWVLSTGRPYVGVDGSRDAPSHAAQDAGIAKIQSYDAGRDGPIYLRNNVIYLQFLDQGWSSQAPPGFVAAAFHAAVSRAAFGRKTAVRKMMRRMARTAYVRGW